MTNQLYQLVVRKGPRPGQIITLELDLMTVGRDPLSDIVIEDPEVSRHHASFTQSAEGFLLQDKGSTNGSFVDGERLGGKPVQLKPGQVIMFGSTVTLVYQATSLSDPLATMVAPAAAVELAEPDPPALDEAPVEVPELEPMPAFEEVESVPEDSFEELEAIPSPEVVDPIQEDLIADLERQPELDEEVAAVEEIIPSEPVTDDLSEEAADVLAFDVQESQPFLEEDDDAMATMIEEGPVIPVQEPVELEPLPTFDEPEPEAALPSYPAYDEPVPELELPPEPPPLAPLPSFEEPAPEPVFESPKFAFEQEEAGAAIDSGAPLPDFGAQPVGSTPIQTSGEIVEDKAPGNKNRNLIIGVAAFLLLCCLCLGLLAIISLVVQPF